MIRVNFHRNTQAKIVRHRQKAPMTRGTWLLSAAIFLIVALLIFFLVRSFFGRNAHEQEINQRNSPDSFSCRFP